MTYKIFIIIAIIWGACACSNQVPKGYLEHKVQLKNNLGVVSIFLPPDFDTTYSWTNYSDAKCSDLAMYRIANKRYSLLQETGFIYPVVPDSLFQLTIMQFKYPECDDTTIKINDKILEQKVENYKQSHPEDDIIIKELKKINDRTFALIGIRSYANGIYSSTIILDTEIKGHQIIFKFIYQAKKSIDFIDKIKQCINSIIITAGNTG